MFTVNYVLLKNNLFSRIIFPIIREFQFINDVFLAITFLRVIKYAKIENNEKIKLFSLIADILKDIKKKEEKQD